MNNYEIKYSILFFFALIMSSCNGYKKAVVTDVPVIHEIKPEDKMDNLDHMSWYQGTYNGTYIDENNIASVVVITLGDISTGDNTYILYIEYPDNPEKEPFTKRGLYRWMGVTGSMIQLTDVIGFPHIFTVTKNELIAVEDMDDPNGPDSKRKFILKKK